jgi:two-component system nitrogen regulation response regulator NtrX
MNEIFQNIRVLLIEDDLKFSSFLTEELTRLGMKITPVYSGREAVEKAAKRDYDLIILDLKLPDVSDAHLLKVFEELRKIKPQVSTIIITGEGRIRHAVEAVKKGAYDFIEKPVSLNRLMIPLRNAVQLLRLRRERDKFYQQIAREVRLIGNSPAIREVLDRIAKCAAINNPVLITGETGTGKELAARAIHLAGGRAETPYVKLNCAAIPKELLESELFGHVKGAFTGALRDKPGKFLAADGGTLFMDEIGDLDPAAQAKILRVLEDGEVTPVGSETSRKVEVRLISATNRDLKRMVEEGAFRRDLFYRLTTVVIEIPPLRQRVEDIPLLVEEFLKRYGEENGLAEKEISPEAMSRLVLYDWPGNVRQLKSVVENLCIFSDQKMITPKDVESLLDDDDEFSYPSDAFKDLKRATAEFQRKIILATLAKNDWKIAETARELDVNRTHLYKKLKDLDIHFPS